MEPVPAPHILDPSRVLYDESDELDEIDLRAQSDRLHAGLESTSAYAQQLWESLANVRQYLYDAAPAGSADDDTWANWSQHYAAVTSVLCGPKGDSGFGRESATAIQQQRRNETASDRFA